MDEILYSEIMNSHEEPEKKQEQAEVKELKT